MDNDRKSDKKNVSVSSLKCNNINVNVNGLELNILPPFLGGGVAATASDRETNANSFANNGDGSQINDFRFVCINNNNNTVIEAEEEPPTPPTPPEPITCEECFTENLSAEQLNNLTYVLSLLSVQNLEGLCEILFADPTATSQEQISIVKFIFNQASIFDETVFNQILECLEII